jgi:hypothetical protein
MTSPTPESSEERTLATKSQRGLSLSTAVLGIVGGLFLIAGVVLELGTEFTDPDLAWPLVVGAGSVYAAHGIQKAQLRRVLLGLAAMVAVVLVLIVGGNWGGALLPAALAALIAAQLRRMVSTRPRGT